MPDEPQFSELNSEEVNFVHNASDLGGQICRRYGRTGVSADDFDFVYASWATDRRADKPSDEEVGSGLGAFFADHMCAALGFRWCIVTDQFGTGYCIRHDGGMASYPFDFVAKRIQDGETQGGFFRALYDLLRSKVV